jgi:hypothetical protein
MVDLLKALMMEGLQIKHKADTNMEKSERTLAKYYSQIGESNHKLKFTKPK